jgi:hypothetical protein
VLRVSPFFIPAGTTQFQALKQQREALFEQSHVLALYARRALPLH